MLNRQTEEISRRLISDDKRLEKLETKEGPGASQVAISAFSLLPQLRGLWAMSTVNEGGNVYDFSEQDRVLSDNGNPTYNVDGLAPYIELDGVGDYLSRVDEAGLDITGTESFVHPDIQGLTFGGWYWFDNALGNLETLISKWAGVGQYAYRLIRVAASGFIRLQLSGDGTAVDVATSTIAPDVDTWFFAVGRFEPSTELAVFLNYTKYTNTVGIPASVFNSNADLQIGASLAAGRLTGRASINFLCAAYLSDTIIRTIFQSTRALYGV